MPARAVAIAYATALQESNLANLHYGTLDSVGVFQQRPSQGWGTVAQIENPVYASGRFFAALARVPDYWRMPIYRAAQAVQHSADGQAYAQWAVAGTLLAQAFTGSLARAVWCSYGTGVGRARLAAASQALTGTFGPLRAGAVDPDRIAAGAGDPDGRRGAGHRSRAVAVGVSSTRQGWAVAAWLVSHAASFGIADVQYQGYRWLANTGPGRWTAVRGGARRPAATGTVVFG